MKDDTDLQFVDTNVLVYAHDVSAGEKHEIAKKLLIKMWNSKKGCLSSQVLSEFYVTITRKVKKPLSSAEASQIISDLGFWNVDVPDVGDILEAIKISQRYMISFWDSMIICSAANLKCSVIWSEDMNPGQYYNNIKVDNPFLL